MSDPIDLCAKCDKAAAEVVCSCNAKFCGRCFKKKHLVSNPRHTKAGDFRNEQMWDLISGKFDNGTDLAIRFKEDEDAKWFGLHTETTTGQDRTTSIVETSRLRDLMSNSVCYYKDSPKRQFPSIVSFVGDTGAGKSTLGTLQPITR
jgi:hypothetical protein